MENISGPSTQAKKKQPKRKRERKEREERKSRRKEDGKDGHDPTTRNAERIRERDGTKRVGREREMRKER